MGNYTIRPNPIDGVIATDGLLFEGLAYNQTTEVLSWVDILSGQVFLKTLGMPESLTQKHAMTLPSATLMYADELIVAANSHLYWYSITGLVMQRKTRVPSKNQDLVTNEMKLDPFGNIWIGMMDRGGRTTGELWVLASDGEFSQFSGSIGIPNTLLWDLGRDKFFYGDSEAGIIYVQPVSSKRSHGKQSVFFSSPSKSAGVPDGSELIGETGSVLNCRWDGGAIFEISTKGDLVNVWRLPWLRPTDIVRLSERTFAVSTAESPSLNSEKNQLGAVFEFSFPS